MPTQSLVGYAGLPHSLVEVLLAEVEDVQHVFRDPGLREAGPDDFSAVDPEMEVLAIQLKSLCDGLWRAKHFSHNLVFVDKLKRCREDPMVLVSLGHGGDRVVVLEIEDHVVVTQRILS